MTVTSFANIPMEVSLQYHLWLITWESSSQNRDSFLNLDFNLK